MRAGFGVCALALVALSGVEGFTGRAALSSRGAALYAKKGFGKEQPKKEKSAGQVMWEDAQQNYEELRDSGVPEYNIFIREAGMGDDKWIPAGAMCVPRDEKVDGAIFANEEALTGSVIRMYPGLKTCQAFEYGFNRKIFPDDPIRLARPPDNNDFVGNFLNQVLSPLNTNNMKKKDGQ